MLYVLLHARIFSCNAHTIYRANQSDCGGEYPEFNNYYMLWYKAAVACLHAIGDIIPKLLHVTE